jgi:hypothetical protein
MVKYINIVRTYVDLQNVFVIAMLITSLLIMFNMITSRTKYLLNISAPNVYVFEYERHSKNVFSAYQILNILIRILGFTLLFVSILFYYSNISRKVFPFFSIVSIFILSSIFVLHKYLTVAFIVFLMKKKENLHEIRHIRVTFEIFLNFYLIIFSFFIFFMPIHNMLIFIVITSLIALYYLFWAGNYSNSLIKHINFKTYQFILYLCISEILPIMLVIYWLSFHIL